MVTIEKDAAVLLKSNSSSSTEGSAANSSELAKRLWYLHLPIRINIKLLLLIELIPLIFTPF